MARQREALRKLLLVDDSTSFLEAAVVVLSPEFDCMTVTDPAAVLDACDAEDPDAVLLDLYLDLI